MLQFAGVWTYWRTFRRLAAISPLVLLLAACTSTGAIFSPLQNVPDGDGILYIYRPSAMVSAVVAFSIAVDNVPSGKVASGSYVAIPLKPGLHVIRAGIEDPVEVNITAGRPTYVRMTVSISYGVKFLQEREERDALPELQKLPIMME